MSFYEVVYLKGDVDMYYVINVFLKEEKCREEVGNDCLILMCLDYGY